MSKNTHFPRCTKFAVLALTGAFLTISSPATHALVFGPDFAADYTATSLNFVPGLPAPYGGLTFLNGDPNTLLIGGTANELTGAFYTVGVTRDSNGHIDGYASPATVYNGGNIGENNDGGVAFGPNGVLFATQWPFHRISQTLPGSVDEDKITEASAIGIPGDPNAEDSTSALNFVPAGFAGAGQLKVVSWDSGTWCSVPYSPDGAGTFDLGPATCSAGLLPGGPEGFVYIEDTNPGFASDSLLISEWSAGVVSAYEIDANGDPIIGTRREFISDLTGAEGAAIDPLTGDFLFSTFSGGIFGGNDEIIIVQGFVAPSSVDTPASMLLMLAGIVLIPRVRRSHQQRLH